MSVLAIVYIPDLGQFCDARLRPVFCGNRAASSLNLGIRGFVTCEEMGIYDDGSISAICWKRGVDLGAYLIRQGLALAGPRCALRVPGAGAHCGEQRPRHMGFRVDQIIRPWETLAGCVK
jgi:endonuclease YncB( thermonuclease family)